MAGTPAGESDAARVPGAQACHSSSMGAKEWESWLESALQLGLGAGQMPLLCISPLATLAGATPAIETCSFLYIGPLEDVRVPHFVGGFCLFLDPDEGAEPSWIGGKTPSMVGVYQDLGSQRGSSAMGNSA